MTTYNRIPIRMGTGRAVLEYGGNMCRVTLNLQGRSTDKLYKPYLLWEDRYMLLPPLNVDRQGRCALRCEPKAEEPEKIRALAVISEELEPAAVGFVNGEYDWRKCFMLPDPPAEEKPDISEAASVQTETPAPQNTEAPAPQTETKEVFKSIVCRLNDDIHELKEYARMPDTDNAALLFDGRERVEPFYGSKGEWVKINLRDLVHIGSLWKYMNNPLVLYACRHYRYLLLGRDGGSLMLGVPVTYDPSYRLEAGIQGFNDIKPVENVPLAKGTMCCLIMDL